MTHIGPLFIITVTTHFVSQSSKMVWPNEKILSFPVTWWEFFGSVGPQSVDSLYGGFFTRVFSAVGRLGKKKKSHKFQTYPKSVLNCNTKHNYYSSNRKKWHLPPHFKGSYLSVGLIGGKIWQFTFFPNFGQFFFSTGAFWSAWVDPPFKESTDSGLSDYYYLTYLTIWVCPSAQAAWSGVHVSSSCLFTSAPLLTSRRTAMRFPSNAAWCKGVIPKTISGYAGCSSCATIPASKFRTSPSIISPSF